MMTPKEREDWRNLVETAPLLPPLSPAPPLPHSVPTPRKESFVTNGN
jgi:hypothetical protein